MPFRMVPNTGQSYGLLSYDRDGRERPEPDGSSMSSRLLDRVKTEKPTNIFFFSHGWQGDVPAAIEQYDAWLGAFIGSTADWRRAESAFPGFKPMLIGLHWPSKAWGDEDVGAPGSFATGAGAGAARPGPAALIESYLERLGDTPAIRAAVEIIVSEARRNAAPDALPARVRQAYLDLNNELGLGAGGPTAPPDADREGFDPDDGFEAGDAASFGGLNLGGLLGPLRQLTYWNMKKRARSIGEQGMHSWLKEFETATEAAGTRIHLMGHSFGCIVVSSMVAGPNGSAPLRRPVDSLTLIQGAVSLWTYSPRIPIDDGGTGYFSRILTDGKIKGPFVTTRSKHDTAVGVLYPFASRVRGTPAFRAGYPRFGAIGAFGAQGLPAGTAFELPMRPATDEYRFEKGRVYNLDAQAYVAKKAGVSGAHNDIAGPEVAHMIWEAAIASA